MKHLLWDVWKDDDGKWKLQMPNGIATYKTKKVAVKMSNVCNKNKKGE